MCFPFEGLGVPTVNPTCKMGLASQVLEQFASSVTLPGLSRIQVSWPWRESVAKTTEQVSDICVVAVGA